MKVQSATEGDSWIEKAISGMVAEQYSRMLSARMIDVRSWEASQGHGQFRSAFGALAMLIANEQIDIPQLAFELYATKPVSLSSVADAPEIKLVGKHQLVDSLQSSKSRRCSKIRSTLAACGAKDRNFQAYIAAVIDLEYWQAVRTEISRRGATADHSHRVASQPAFYIGLRAVELRRANVARRNNGAYYNGSRHLGTSHQLGASATPLQSAWRPGCCR